MGQIAEECNLDVERGEIARALHRVVRAMHDGHCPKCGHLAPSETFYHPGRVRIDPPLIQPGFHKCPACHFTVTHEESEAALAEFRPYLNKSVEVFETWRQLHNQHMQKVLLEPRGIMQVPTTYQAS